jgi:hypothetical protein
MDTPRTLRAWLAFDAANAQDPNTIEDGGRTWPRELFFAQRLSEWVSRLCPEASEALRLASRCQHICRWQIPRTDYEPTRGGYLRWRSDLKRFHAAQAVRLLAEAGFDAETAARVRSLNLKENLGEDPEVQVLEDALCLVTLQYQLAELAEKTEHAKMISILQKTWRKMSRQAHEAALQLPYAERERALLAEALA